MAFDPHMTVPRETIKPIILFDAFLEHYLCYASSLELNRGQQHQLQQHCLYIHKAEMPYVIPSPQKLNGPFVKSWGRKRLGSDGIQVKRIGIWRTSKRLRPEGAIGEVEGARLPGGLEDPIHTNFRMVLEGWFRSPLRFDLWMLRRNWNWNWRRSSDPSFHHDPNKSGVCGSITLQFH